MDNTLADKPIGIFDSGVGGLAIAAELRKLMPQEHIIYYADRANFPYGSKTAVEVQALAEAATCFLLDKGVKMVVVACNTASASALSYLRATFAIPFIGTVPAIKPASSTTTSGIVGVMATEGTLQAQVFKDLLSQFATGVEIVTQVCPELVDMVEEGSVHSPELEPALRSYLEPLLQRGIDTLVLGCTHYSFLRPTVEKLVGPRVAVLETSLPVARQAYRVALEHGMARDSGGLGSLRLYTSGNEAEFLSVVDKLLAGKVLS